MDIEWQFVQLSTTLQAQRLDSIIVRTHDDQEAVIPFSEIMLTENKELKTREEICADYIDRCVAKIEEMKRDTYYTACENFDGPPKVAIVFISKNLTLTEGIVKRETFAHAEVGIACFGEEIDMDQFMTLVE